MTITKTANLHVKLPYAKDSVVIYGTEKELSWIQQVLSGDEFDKPAYGQTNTSQ